MAFSLAPLAALKPADDPGSRQAPLGFVGAVTTPCGLTGTDTMQFITHSWTNVPTARNATHFMTASIASKQIIGPGIPAQTWTYRYTN